MKEHVIELFKYPRELTGFGFNQALNYIKKFIPIVGKFAEVASFRFLRIYLFIILVICIIKSSASFSVFSNVSIQRSVA